MIKEPDDIDVDKKIKGTLSIHKLIRKRNQKGEYNTSFFKYQMKKNRFMFSGREIIIN